jgi:hypothetical protein
MSLRIRRSKLEGSTGGSDRCLSCPLPSIVTVFRQNDRGGDPVPTGAPEPPPCQTCGRLPP